MLQSKVYEITSTDDIELNIKRESKLEFKVSFDEAKEMKALLVFISGIRDIDYAQPNAPHSQHNLPHEFL